MGHTYHKVYLQFVFAVKYRHAVLDKKWHKLQTCASKGIGALANALYKATGKRYYDQPFLVDPKLMG